MSAGMFAGVNGAVRALTESGGGALKIQHEVTKWGGGRKITCQFTPKVVVVCANEERREEPRTVYIFLNDGTRFGSVLAFILGESYGNYLDYLHFGAMGTPPFLMFSGNTLELEAEPGDGGVNGEHRLMIIG